MEPHLGYMVGTSTATHGYCIGSYLKSPTKAELNVHYTDVVAAAPAGAPGVGPGSTAAVQQHNYATAFRLAHSESLAQQIRRGQIEGESIPFSLFEWLGRRWITAPAGLGLGDLLTLSPLMSQRSWAFGTAPASWGAPTFAVESTYAATILRELSGVRTSLEFGFNLSPFPRDLRLSADRETNGSAAIFPDGLAVFIRGQIMDKTTPVIWLRGKAEFVPAGSWREVYSEKKHQDYLTGG